MSSGLMAWALYLIEIDCFHAEPAGGRLRCVDDVLRASPPRHGRELCRHNDVLARCRHAIACQLFAFAKAVCLGRVDEVDPRLKRGLE